MDVNVAHGRSNRLPFSAQRPRLVSVAKCRVDGRIVYRHWAYVFLVKTRLGGLNRIETARRFLVHTRPTLSQKCYAFPCKYQSNVSAVQLNLQADTWSLFCVANPQQRTARLFREQQDCSTFYRMSTDCRYNVIA